MLNTCPQCGKILPLTSVLCDECLCAQGLEALAGVDPAFRVKNQRLATWFGILLGGFGLHRFYLGQYPSGFLYLLFCWTLVPTLLGWRDAFLTGRMTPSAFEFKYCRRSLLG